MSNSPLWFKEDLELPYVGVYGPFGSGKTLFLLGIRPKETCYIGLEFSATTYVKEARVKAHYEIHEELGTTRDKVTPVDIWIWFETFIRNMPEDEFEVLAIDTIGDLEQGLPDYIASQHKSFGYSTPEKFRAAKGLFWGAVKKYLESLMHFVRSKKGIKTIAWAAHLKTVWEGGSPTSRKTNQGFDVWNKTASLVLELRREVVSGVQQEAPCGILRKGRLSVPRNVDEHGEPVEDEFGEVEWVTVLPPRMAKCTPGQIRRYIAEPAYLRKLRKDEKLKDEKLTADEKLLIEQEISRNKAAVAETQKELHDSRVAQSQRASEATQSAKVNVPEAEPPKTEEAPFSAQPVTSDSVRDRIGRLISSGILQKEDAAALIKSCGGHKIVDLDQEGLEKLDKSLDEKEWNENTKKDLQAAVSG